MTVVEGRFGAGRGVCGNGRGDVAPAFNRVPETLALHPLEPQQAALASVRAATVPGQDRGTAALAAPTDCSPA